MFSDFHFTSDSRTLMFYEKKVKMEILPQKKQKRNQTLQKREVSDTKAKEAEKDFVEYYDFNRL